MPVEHLPRHLVNQLLHLAQSSPDSDVYGLIGSRSGRPTTVYPIAAPVPKDGETMLLDTESSRDALQRMNNEGEELFAIFDSRPVETAGFRAEHADVLHLAISLATKGVLEVRGFRPGAEQRPEEIELLLDHEA